MKILVVDDNKGYRTVMGDLLKDAGHEVFLAENGKQAREFIEQKDIELIVCDVFMPTMDGIRFHSYVREFTDSQNVPFIFVSGYDEENTRGLIVDPNLDFFFSKNEPIETIIEAIAKLNKSK
jgi:CheY-like chemotaxis protein